MLKHHRVWWSCGVLCAVVFLNPLMSSAADRVNRIKAAGKFNPKDASVDVFKGIEDGQLEVKVIAKSAKLCRVFVTNKTDKPLNVSMPSGIAAVPVLAQNGFFPNVNRNNRNNNGPQATAGGIGNNPIGGNRGGPFMNLRGNNGPNRFFNLPNFDPGNQFFNVAPEKVATLKLQTVCLEHGKPDPRPQFQYELKPLTEMTEKPEVYLICTMLGDGKMDQRVAQAATWHLANGLSWNDLESKKGESTFGRHRAPLFSGEELALAKKAVEEVTKQVETYKSRSKKPSESAMFLGRGEDSPWFSDRF